MSRPIKFRAWDFSSEKMKYEVTLDPNGKVAAFSTLTGSYVRGFSDDEMKLMQYTGLRDRNGKEIYEGDILSTDLDRPYLVVEYRNGAFMYQCHDSGKDYFDFMGPSDEEITVEKYNSVIGNIYENPELLKGEGAE